MIEKRVKKKINKPITNPPIAKIISSVKKKKLKPNSKPMASQIGLVLDLNSQEVIEGRLMLTILEFPVDVFSWTTLTFVRNIFCESEPADSVIRVSEGNKFILLNKWF